MKPLAIFLYSLVSVALAGCTGTSEDDLRQWLAEERSKTLPKVTPIPAPKQFKPAPYENAGEIEPFSNQKLTQALRRDSAQVASNAGLVAPELLRRKEPLEAFPVDAMAMVGSLTKEGQPIALVKVDSLLYQVKLGNYLGQNYGRVVKINETEVVLREIVQDAIGEWIERASTLQLQEGSK
jgi:type IV pilus assembly protein PilP